jgi:preprotein translocase subunit YajC
MELASVAYAMGSLGQGGSGQGAGGITTFIPLILMGVIFYFLLIRPQQKKQKEHRNMLASLKKGDAVITSGGLHGRVTGLTDQVATLEIAEKVRVKVSRAYIAVITARETPE